MGAPKQKWTAEEELALKAGIEKHGAGKWRTILKDPEFSRILYLRSNVDLKDKWRNMSVTSHDWGSRARPRISWKKTQQVQKHDNSLAMTTVDEDIDNEIVDANPLAISDEILQIPNADRSIPRLDDIVLEAITNLKDPTGSSMTAIAIYIEEEYWSPPNLESMLSAKLKALTANGKLVKVKRKYRIAPVLGFSSRRSSRKLPIEGKQKELIRSEIRDFKAPKYQIDAEIARMKSMSSHEAVAAAAQAMIEAEAAIAEAEEAAREAEIAEADAEAAHAFADAAKLTLTNRAITDRLSMQEN